MRLDLPTVLCMAALATPASAQVQQNNPNAANQSFEAESNMRSLQQEQTTQSDTLQMNSERNLSATPAPNTGPDAIGPRGGTGVVGR
jgi:hypothetical protein